LSRPEPAPDVLDEVGELRRHLHRHPEVGFEEHATSRLIAERLSGLGVSVLPCPTPTGALAALHGGRPGRTVMIRADIDALPILEDSGVQFASTSEGRMHACGHDAHTAILLGVARTLAARAEDLPGRYVFVFQPAEEIVSGAKAMIEHGLFDQLAPAPDAAVGLHVWSTFKSGTVITRPGVLWGGSDAFDITLSGPGGATYMIGRRGNVISAQAFILERLHTVVEGLEHDGVPCNCLVGEVRAEGGTWNVVPPRVLLRGSLRTFSRELREQALERLRGLLVETGTEFDVGTELVLRHGTVPIENDPGVTSTVLETARELIGGEAGLLGRPMVTSDDMAEFLARVPGCYFMLGAQPPDAEVAPLHHSPGFRIDEAAFATGVRVLAAAAARLAEPQR
jgi:amidohydrolase